MHLSHRLSQSQSVGSAPWWEQQHSPGSKAQPSAQVVYLFLEQVQWLIKAGLVAKRFSPRITKARPHGTGMQAPTALRGLPSQQAPCIA